MTRVLITGMSGTGKSTVIARLAALGYSAVDLDEPEWSEWAVPATVDANPADELEPDWIWKEDRVRALLDRDNLPHLYLSGCSPNQGRFYHHLDRVVLLSAPIEVMLVRVVTRTTNTFGKRAEERAKVLRDTREVLPLLRGGADVEIDTSTASIDEVVATLIDLSRDA